MLKKHVFACINDVKSSVSPSKSQLLVIRDLNRLFVLLLNSLGKKDICKCVCVCVCVFVRGVFVLNTKSFLHLFHSAAS